MVKNRVKISRFLSLVLRHKPQDFGLTLDKHGYADFDRVVELLKSRFSGIEQGDVKSIIRNDLKKRFQMKDHRIRARYGHSVDVEPLQECRNVPDVLFHGTSPKNLDSILKNGLKPGKRRFVHLSINVQEAIKVGKRKDGNPVVFQLDARRAKKDGLKFWKESNIYLTSEVSPQYLSIRK